MKTTLMNMENSKTNEQHKFVLKSSQRLNLKRSDRHVALRKLSNYYTRKNLRKQYKSNKLKIIAPAWNNESELLGGSYSVSDILDHFQYIIKRREILTAILPTHVYINRINDRLVFEIKDG